MKTLILLAALILPPPPLAAQRLSIVVTPFANLSGDPGQDYLVDALTDELTTSLARLNDTFVIARNTAMTFKGKPQPASVRLAECPTEPCYCVTWQCLTIKRTISQYILGDKWLSYV